MCDYFSLLPDELFIFVIFPQLSLLKAMTLKQVSKRYKKLADEYQQKYNKSIHISYDRLHLLEDKLPNIVCYSDIYVTDKVRSITSYKALKHLSISFINSDRFIASNMYHSELYQYEENLNSFDVSNLRDLQSLAIFDLFGNYQIPALLTLTNLTKLEMIHCDIAIDLSPLVNLKELLIIKCPNITVFPAHLTLSIISESGRIVVISTQKGNNKLTIEDFD